MPPDKEEEFEWFGIPTLSIDGFPPDFKTLKSLYEGFIPRFEHHRDSIDDMFGRVLKKYTWDDLVSALLDPKDGIRAAIVQRLFYRSCVAFYRFYDLFLAFLTLDGAAFKTWSEVTGYYSRFFFVQAWLNLLQSCWVDLGKVSKKYSEMSRPPRNFESFFMINSSDEIKLLGRSALKKASDHPELNFFRSHQIWWTLFNSARNTESFEFIDSLDFVLTPFYFNPKQRNDVNYSFNYLEGFIELEWFDNTPDQMVAHFMPMPRPDRDFTEINAFFEGDDPEYVDVGDFYGDDVQILWGSCVAYLQLLRALNIKQDFITADKLGKLLEQHLGDTYPSISGGISRSINSILN